MLSVMSTDITESHVTSSRLVACVNALGYLSGHWTRKHSGRSTGAGLGGMSVDADHREPFAAQRMQVTAAGRAASRSSPMGWPHRSQIPYVPVSSRCSGNCTRPNACVMSCAASDPAPTPTCPARQAAG